MSTFPKEPPTTILTTQEETKAYATNPNWLKPTQRILAPHQEANLKALRIANNFTTDTSWTVKSLWLISLIDELAGDQPDKVVYNAEIKAEAHKRLGLGTLTDKDAATEGDALSRLVYNAQCYRHSDRLQEQGYVPLTQALIDATGEGGTITPHTAKLFTIVVNGKDDGDPQPASYTIKSKNGKLYAMLPKSRTKALAVHGQPVKATPKPQTRPRKAK
jgi:hypothetical protein